MDSFISKVTPHQNNYSQHLESATDSIATIEIISEVDTEEIVRPFGKQLILQIEDPNEPPYHMFIGAYLGETLQFTFDVPDGEFFESPDTLLQFKMRVQEGTNLSEELFSIYTNTGECSTANPLNVQPEDVVNLSTVNIGELVFLKTESGSSGAGQSYVTHAYSFDHNGYCTTFAIELHSGALGAYESAVTVYDEDVEIEKMEALLKTIKIQNE